jgi:hypothetical protein
MRYETFNVDVFPICVYYYYYYYYYYCVYSSPSCSRSEYAGYPFSIIELLIRVKL